MEEEYPISFYLGVEQGRHADLRVVAQAGIAFANLVEQVAKLIDPFGEVRVEIISGTEGSFDFNAVVRPLRSAYDGVKAGLEKRPPLKWLVIYVAFRIINNGIDWTQDKVMDWMASPDAPAVVHTMSKAEREGLAKEIIAQMRPMFAKSDTEALYSIIRRDPAICSVGVSAIPKKVPQITVPQSDFAERSGTAAKEDGETRTRGERADVVLISPVLMDSDRRWKFRGANGEFGAPMKDKKFLVEALSGRIGMPLQQELHMDVDLEIIEVSRDGVWRSDSFAVTHVWGWKEPPQQGGLFPPGTDDVDGDEQP